MRSKRPVRSLPAAAGVAGQICPSFQVKPNFFVEPTPARIMHASRSLSRLTAMSNFSLRTGKRPRVSGRRASSTRSGGSTSGVLVTQVIRQPACFFRNAVTSGVVRITSPIAPSLIMSMFFVIASYSSHESQIFPRSLFGSQGMCPWKCRQSNFTPAAVTVRTGLFFFIDHPWFEEFIVQPVEEPRGFRQDQSRFAVIDVDRVGDEQVFLRARAGHVHQPALLLQFVGIVHRSEGGETAVE